MIPPSASAPDTSIDVSTIVGADDNSGTTVEPIIPIASSPIEVAAQEAGEMTEPSVLHQEESKKGPMMDLPLVSSIGEAISAWWAFTQGSTINESLDSVPTAAAVSNMEKELPSTSSGPSTQRMIEVLGYDSDIAKIRGVVNQIRPQFGALDQLIEVISYSQNNS